MRGILTGCTRRLREDVCHEFVTNMSHKQQLHLPSTRCTIPNAIPNAIPNIMTNIITTSTTTTTTTTTKRSPARRSEGEQIAIAKNTAQQPHGFDRITPKQEVELATSIQKGVKVFKVKKVLEEEAKREVGSKEWSEVRERIL